jgi:hypothetical protein
MKPRTARSIHFCAISYALALFAIVPRSISIAQIAPGAENTPTSLTSLPHIQDSLSLERLALEIAYAARQVLETDLWHRLLPKVALSAGLAGGGDLLVFYPYENSTPIIVRSSIRLSINLALSDLFSDADHEKAILDLRKLCLSRTEISARIDNARNYAREKRKILLEEHQILTEQYRLMRNVHMFKQMQFDRGKIDFDALTRSEMDLLSMKIRINRLEADIRDVARGIGQSVVTDSLRTQTE